MKKLETLFLTTALLAATATAGCAVVGKIEAGNAAAPTTNSEREVSETAPNADPTNASADATAAQKNAPDALVKDLYKQHEAGKSPFFQTKSRALVDKYFVKETADLIWNDAVNPRGETGAINNDPLYDAHDTDESGVKNFAVAAPRIAKNEAIVGVSFVNMGEKQTITFALRRQNNDWKIYDIRYGRGRSLLKFWSPEPEIETPDEPKSKVEDSDAEGLFEGTYQVGSTTCTVKSIRQAFEVKWKQGKGTMIFFAEEPTRYVSGDASQSRDMFVFDDESLSTGKFIRADGKEMPVRRIK